MDFNPLWFIKCDDLLLAQPPDYAQLLGLIDRQAQFLQECIQTGLQLDLYEIICIVDGFFSPERIVEVIAAKHQIFTDDQLTEIQTRTTEFRILIQCEKLYANKCWLNKKRDQSVEVRILACLLRIYLLFQKAWQFFVGDYPNIKTRLQKSRLILPLSKLKPFVNDVYIRLQRIEPYYYKYENQRFILETHVLFKAFKQLLFEFPNITQNEVVKELDLKNIILRENQLYKKNYVERILRSTASPLKKPIIRPRRYTDLTQQIKVKSLDHRKLWQRRFSVNTKIRKTSESLVRLCEGKQSSSSPYPIIRFPFRPVVISRREKQFTQSSMQKSISQCASTRNISDTRSRFPSRSRINTMDQYVPRQSMSPTRIPKTKSRRAIVDSQVLGAIKQQLPEAREVSFQFESMGEKQAAQYTLAKYHSAEIRENKVEQKTEKLKLKEEIQVVGGLAKSASEIQIQIQKVLERGVHLKPLKRNKYQRESLEQQ